MKNKLLLLSTALFGVVSLGNYVHSMDLTHDMEKREVCINRLSEIGEVSSILINKKLNTTKEEFDFICQKDPSIIYQAVVIFLQHTNFLHKNELFSTLEAIKNYNFVISNIIQRTGTDHEGLAKLREADESLYYVEGLLSNAIQYFDSLSKSDPSSNNMENLKQLNDNVEKLNTILEPILHTTAIYPFELDHLFFPEVYKYGYKRNSIEYAIKYDDMNSIIKMSAQTNFFNHRIGGTKSLLDFAAYHGSVEAFNFFISNNLPITESTYDAAIIGGNKEILQKCSLQNNSSSQYRNYAFITNSIMFGRYELTNYALQSYPYYPCDKRSLELININFAIGFTNIPMFIKVVEDKSNPFYNLNNPKLLHKCCEYNQKEMAEILLIDGADVNYTDEENRKPIDVAQTDEMRELLRQYGAN